MELELSKESQKNTVHHKLMNGIFCKFVMYAIEIDK